jgi:hypothetical protein
VGGTQHIYHFTEYPGLLRACLVLLILYYLVSEDSDVFPSSRDGILHSPRIHVDTPKAGNIQSCKAK